MEPTMTPVPVQHWHNMGAVLLALACGLEPNRDISKAISTDGCLQVYANKVHTESGIPINTTCLPL